MSKASANPRTLSAKAVAHRNDVGAKSRSPELKRPAAKFKVRRAKGRLVIDGVNETNLVMRGAVGRYLRAPGKPKHLTTAQISDMVKLMRVK